MPATRSSSRVTASTSLFPVKKPLPATSPAKKRTITQHASQPAPKRLKVVNDAPSIKTLPVFSMKPAHLDPNRVIPANLTFDFQQAKEHLTAVDSRFAKVFETLPCRPFENLEPVDPFRRVWATIPDAQLQISGRNLTQLTSHSDPYAPRLSDNKSPG